jgi:membrane-associated phospholipid phosphatase
MLARFVRALPGWFQELTYSLGPDLILLAVFSVLLGAMTYIYGGHFSMLHASTLMPLGAMVVLMAVSLVGRLRAKKAGSTGTAEQLARVSWAVVRDWFPLILILAVYSNFHDMTRLVRPDTVDQALLDLDIAIFGVEPTVALQQYTWPWLTEYMTVAYALFFAFPTLILVRLYVSGDFLRFREFGLALSLCFYIGLVGYLTVPAIGPRYTVTYDVPLTGYVLTDAAARTWRMIENIQTDCFPSLHTAVSSICLVYFWRLRAWRGGKLLLWICTPLIVSLIMSTLYLRYHYTVDIFAGWALTALCVYGAPAIVARYYRGRARREQVRSFAPVGVAAAAAAAPVADSLSAE